MNCTTIDWFSEWPSDALLEVAERYLEKIQLANDEVYFDKAKGKVRALLLPLWLPSIRHCDPDLNFHTIRILPVFLQLGILCVLRHTKLQKVSDQAIWC